MSENKKDITSLIKTETDKLFVKSVYNRLTDIASDDITERHYRIRDYNDEGIYGIEDLTMDIIDRRKLIGNRAVYTKEMKEFKATDEFGFVDLAELTVSVVKWSLIKGRSLQSCAVKLGDTVLRHMRYDDKDDSLAIRNKRRFKIGDFLMYPLRRKNIINYRVLFTSDEIAIIKAYKEQKQLDPESRKTEILKGKVDKIYFKSSLMVEEGTNPDSEKILERLYYEIEDSRVDYKTYPKFDDIPDFDSFYNDHTRSKLIKGLPEEYESYFTYDNCPLVFDAFNYLKEGEFGVEEDLLNLYEKIKKWEKKKYKKSKERYDYELTLEHLNMDIDDLEKQGLQDIEELNLSPKKKEKAIDTLKSKMKRKRQGIKSMLIEINETLKMARKTLKRTKNEGKGFKQHPFGDYRLRTYFKTSFFHVQGSKNARSLINFWNGEKLEEHGWDSLLKSASSNFGLDKKTQKEQLDFANKNIDSGFWLAYIEDPINPIYDEFNKKIDNKPGFRGDLQEIKRALDYEKSNIEGATRYNYPSNRICYLDYCTSLIMIMSAMVGDLDGLKLCNAMDYDERFDSYEKVAGIAFDGVKFDDKDKSKLEMHIAKIDELKAELKDIPAEDKSKIKAKKKQIEYRRSCIEDLQSMRFWSQSVFKDPKLRRALIKRNVMLVFYGSGVATGSKYILKENEFDPLFALLDSKKAKWLVRRVRQACYTLFPGAMLVMNIVNRMCEIKFDKGEDFIITEPVTLGRMHLQGKALKTDRVHSSFVRYVTEEEQEDGKIKKKYSFEKTEGSKLVEHQPRVVSDEISLKRLNKQMESLVNSPDYTDDKYERLDTKKKKMKADVTTAAVTAVIHFLDATILRAIILGAKEQGFHVSVIHDSVGCLPSRIPDLWKLGRDKFVEVIAYNIMKHILDDPDYKKDKEIKLAKEQYLGRKLKRGELMIWEDEDKWEGFLVRLSEGMNKNEFNFC